MAKEYTVPAGEVWFQFDGDVTTYETGAFSEQRHKAAEDAVADLESEFEVMSKKRKPNAKPRKTTLATWQGVNFG